MNIRIKCAALFTGLILGGCGSTIHTVAKVDGIDTLSVDAKQRLITVNDQGGPAANKRVVCAEPSPDALVASASSLAAQGSVPGKGSAALANSYAEAAASIGLRSQPIQLMRDGYFRLCEAYMNGAIKEDEYRKVVSNVDSVLAVVMAIDSLGSGPVAPAVAIAPGQTTARTGDDDAEAIAGAPAAVSIGTYNADRTAISPQQALAIEHVIREFLAYKKFLLANGRRRRS